MSQPGKPARAGQGASDPDQAPQSTVQLKTRPLIERQLEQIASDCDAGELSPDAALDEMIAANVEWASRFLSGAQREKLKAYLRELAEHPVMRAKMGREK